MPSLSKDQMAVVNHGLGPAPSWTPLPPPNQLEPLPPWLLGIHIDWMDSYANAPKVRLLVDHHVTRWPDQRWTNPSKGLYLTTHPDGRAQAHYHFGPVTKQWLVGDFGNSAQLWETSPTWDGRYYWRHSSRVRATTLQDGYGGRHFPLLMDDNEWTVLRGPWHGCAPKGYQEVGHVIDKERWDYSRPWHSSGGYFGLLLTDNAFRSIMAHLCPDIRLARVKLGYLSDIQPMKPEWSAPKDWERRARK